MKRLVLILFVGFVLCGRAQPKNETPPIAGSHKSEQLETRNNAASLLYDLLGDEKNVSKLLIIKHTNEELGQLIIAISETAANNHKQMEWLAKSNSNLNLQAVRLPPGEKATREAVAKSEEHELLFSSGQEFELNLLLTQAEALSYGGHLAKVASENSSLPEEVREFATMGQSMKKLYNQVIAQMRHEFK